MTATVPGIATPVTFALTNVAGGTAAVSVVSGTPQTAVAGAAFTAPLEVLVVDAFGNPVEGATVTFAGPATGATATTSVRTATTNAAGIATVTATAGGVAGSYDLTASTPGATTPASFALTNTPGPSTAPDGGTEDGGTHEAGVVGEPDAAEATDSGESTTGPRDATLPTEPEQPGADEGSVTGGGLSCSAARGPAPPLGAELSFGLIGLALVARSRRKSTKAT